MQQVIWFLMRLAFSSQKEPLTQLLIALVNFAFSALFSPNVSGKNLSSGSNHRFGCNGDAPGSPRDRKKQTHRGKSDCVLLAAMHSRIGALHDRRWPARSYLHNISTE